MKGRLHLKSRLCQVRGYTNTTICIGYNQWKI